MATLSVGFRWRSNGIAQLSAGAGVYFRHWRRRSQQLGQPVCDVFNKYKVGKHVQVFDSMFVRVKFMTLSRYNTSGCAVNSQILLACNLQVSGMVKFDMLK